MESRVYAEDPYRNFLPSIGRLKTYLPPEEGPAKGVPGEVRVDSGVREGDEISMFYDPMISKLVTHGATRNEAIDAQQAALDRYMIDGIQDNIPFVAAVYDQDRFRSGNITTAYIKDEFPDGFAGVEPTEEQALLLACSAAYVHGVYSKRASEISGRLSPVPAPREDWVVILDKAHYPIKLRFASGRTEIDIEGQTHILETDWKPGSHLFEARMDGVPYAVKFADRTEGYVFRHRGVSLRALVCTPRSAELHAKLPEKEEADLSKLIMSPMPGLVVSIDVEVGQEVKSGEAVCVVEAMKMQNIIRAETDGVVKAVNVGAGDSVAADEIMVEFD